MKIFLAQLINGVAVGSIYALLVTGLNLMLLVAGVINFCFPHMVALSMYASWYVLEATGDNVLLAILAAVGSGVLLGVVSEPIFRPMSKRGAVIASFIAAIGLSMVITDVMSHEFHYGSAVSFPAVLVGRGGLLQSGGVAVLSRGQLATLIGSVAAAIAFFNILYRTKIGRAFRAMAQKPFVARLLGIPIGKTALQSFALAGLLGGISAIFLSMSLGWVSPGLGEFVGLRVVAVALFAGLGNLTGGLYSALIIGVTEAMACGYIPGDWADAVIYGVIMLVVISKPEGVFGTQV